MTNHKIFVHLRFTSLEKSRTVHQPISLEKKSLRRIVSLPLVLVLSLIIQSGCSENKTAGLYFKKQREVFPTEYIELKRDGTFFLKKRSQSTVGKYQLEPGGYTLVFDGGRASRGQMEGDTLIDKDGERWFLWRGGTSGIEFEKRIGGLEKKSKDFERLIDEGGMTRRQAQKMITDELVKDGLLTKEEVKDLVAKESGGRYNYNKDAIINDMNNFAAIVYKYRVRPSSMGGGNGSYIGFSIPPGWARNENARYEMIVDTNSIALLGSSNIVQGSSIRAIIDKNGRLAEWLYKGEFQ